MSASDSNYDDAAPAEAPEAGADKDGQDDSSEPTTMANKSAFPEDCKPGDKYEVEIVNVHEDEVEFKVGGEAGKEDGGEEEAPADAEMPDSGGGGMSSMLSD